MLYRLSDLKRYNNMPRIKSESLAEHQYYCGLILMKLKDYMFNISYTEFCILLQYVLVHDIGELYTGDIPHNVKQDYPDLRSLLEKIENEKLNSLGFDEIVTTVEEDENLKMLFKLCDTIQVVQYCENEHRLGNNSIVINNIYIDAIESVNLQIKKLKEKKLLLSNFNGEEFINEILGN